MADVESLPGYHYSRSDIRRCGSLDKIDPAAIIPPWCCVAANDRGNCGGDTDSSGTCYHHMQNCGKVGFVLWGFILDF